MSAKIIQWADPLMVRRYLIACEQERLKTKAITPDEMSRVVIATKGERMNFDLIGRVIAEKLRRREVTR